MMDIYFSNSINQYAHTFIIVDEYIQMTHIQGYIHILARLFTFIHRKHTHTLARTNTHIHTHTQTQNLFVATIY
jgi:hypothetical protein